MSCLTRGRGVTRQSSGWPQLPSTGGSCDWRRSGWTGGVPGQDVAGTIETAAADGSGPAVGSRVVAWPEQSGWAEKVAVPTGSIVVLPDSVATAGATTLPVAGVTALGALRRGGLLLARRALITGATGNREGSSPCANHE